MRNIFSFSLILGAIALSSCTTQQLYTTIDVLRPAQVSFDTKTNDILLVNNTAKQPSDVGHTPQLTVNRIRTSPLKADSIALFCLASLTEELENKAFFSSVQLRTNSTNLSGDLNHITPLNKDTVKELCSNYGANVILSLDKIRENDDISEYFDQSLGGYLHILEVSYESDWSVHYPNNPESISVHFKDTVYWQDDINPLPKRYDAIVDGALYSGKHTAERIIPHWDKADRYFFKSHNKYIRQGMDSVFVKNWTAAIELWTIALKSKNSLTKAYAANNIAIAYEITGDINKAIDFATTAYYGYGKSPLAEMPVLDQLYSYVNKLVQRKKEISKLKVQLGE